MADNNNRLMGFTIASRSESTVCSKFESWQC